MLNDILQSLKPELMKILNNNGDLEHTINFLSKFKKNYWIYPGLVKQKTDLSIKTVYEIMSLLEDKGVLTHYYDIICPSCSRSIGEVYSTLDSIPEYLECDHCGNVEGFLAINSAYLIYRVNDNV